MAFTEDLDVFLRLKSAGGLTDAGTYDGTIAVAVLFDAAYIDQLDGLVASAEPAALGRASVFPAAAVGKTLLVGGVTYRIRNREAQDDGALVLLRLEKT